jgi:hypothetical protein
MEACRPDVREGRQEAPRFEVRQAQPPLIWRARVAM